MPDKIANQLRDVFLAHSFDLEKVKNTSAKQISKMLDELILEINRELEFVDPTAVKRTVYQQERLNKLFNMADKTIKGQYGKLEQATKSQLRSLAEIQGLFVPKAINAVMQVNMVDYAVSPEVLNRLVDNTLVEGRAIKDWWAGQSRDLQVDFQRAMRIGISRGETLDQLSARVRGTQSPARMGVRGNVPGVTQEQLRSVFGQPGLAKKAKRNAEALVRSSFSNVANDARNDVYKANSDVIAGEEFLATLDNRTTIECAAYDGGVWDLDGNPIQGTTLPYQRPALHFNCRSIMIPAMKTLEEILGIPGIPEPPESTRSAFSRTGMSGQISDKTNFNSWLKGVGEADQDKILGPKRADLWRRGLVTTKDLVSTKNGQVLTLKELYAKVVEDRFYKPQK